MYKALRIDFSLNPGCYATMAIREIMRETTSIYYHSKKSNKIN